MKKIILIISIIFAILLYIVPLNFAASKKEVKEGNILYNDKRYDEALESYNKALSDFPDSPLIHFNIGDSLYKKGDYEKAQEAFTKALITEDELLEAKANYNIGNCKYRQARLKEDADLSTAIALYREALDYYKNTMRLDEKDQDTKYNHEFVEKRLKVLLDKLKQQQEQQEQQEQKQKEQKGECEEKEGEEEKAQSQPENQEENKDEQDRKKGDQEKETEGQDTEQAGLDKEDKETGEAENLEKDARKEMSEEEARMLLNGYKQEQELRDKMKKRRTRGYYPKVLKDW